MDKADIDLLYKLVTDTEQDGADTVFPVEFEAREHESSAMGFISPKAAGLLEYDYENSGLHEYIAAILDDIEKETEDCSYVFKGIHIYLSR